MKTQTKSKRESAEDKSAGRVSISVVVKPPRSDPHGHMIVIKGTGTADYPFPTDLVATVIKTVNKSLKKPKSGKNAKKKQK